MQVFAHSGIVPGSVADAPLPAAGPFSCSYQPLLPLACAAAPAGQGGESVFDLWGFDVVMCEVRPSHQRHIMAAEMRDGLDAQGHQRQAIISSYILLSVPHDEFILSIL